MSWTDTGGGDHGGADWTPANSLTVGGVHTNIGTFLVTGGYTINVNQGSVFKVYATTATITGTINGNGKGYSGGATSSNGAGPGGGFQGLTNIVGAGGGAYGGDGGNGQAVISGSYGQGGSSYGSNSDSEIEMGSGGGGGGSGGGWATEGGNGGGAVFLCANTITITGTITCNGVSAASDTGGAGGGGAGGSVCIVTCSLTCTAATITCNGGNGGNGSGTSDGGGGGGGRAKFFYRSTDVDPLTKSTVTAGTSISGSNGSIGTENKYEITVCTDTIEFGQTFNFNSAGVVIIAEVVLYAETIAVGGDITLTIWDSPNKVTSYGSKTLSVITTGEKTFTFANAIILPEGTNDYYFECVAAAGKDVDFAISGGGKYSDGDYYRNVIKMSGMDAYMKIYTYPHVVNPQVYNNSDTDRKCDIAGLLLTGAVHRINADGSGHIDYDDDFTTAKYAGDQAGLSGISHDDTDNELDIAAGGYIYYKVDTKYPILGIPTLTQSRINVTAGSPTIQIAEDSDGEPSGWHNITDSIVDDTITDYELDAEDLSLEGKTILYFRIDCAGSAAASLKYFNLDIDLDTSTALIPVVDEGGAANTFRCDQDASSSIDGTVTLYYNDAKYAG